MLKFQGLWCARRDNPAVKDASRRCRGLRSLTAVFRAADHYTPRSEPLGFSPYRLTHKKTDAILAPVLLWCARRDSNPRPSDS